jgi:hypothetical protein
MKTWTDTIKLFRNTLIKAQEQRKNKNQWVDDPNGNDKTLQWILFERQTMLDFTNAERQKNGFQPLLIEKIIRAENFATGHIDYTYKLALYCARMSRNENGDME